MDSMINSDLYHLKMLLFYFIAFYQIKNFTHKKVIIILFREVFNKTVL